MSPTTSPQLTHSISISLFDPSLSFDCFQSMDGSGESTNSTSMSDSLSLGVCLDTSSLFFHSADRALIFKRRSLRFSSAKFGVASHRVLCASSFLNSGGLDYKVSDKQTGKAQHTKITLTYFVASLMKVSTK